MKMIVLTVCFLLFSLFVPSLLARQSVPPPPAPVLQTAIKTALRSPELMKSLNKQVTVQGFYYAGSIPMVVDDITRTYLNIPMPPESYIPLTGHLPAGVKSGDKISVKGILRKPVPTDPRYVTGESAIIASEEIRKLTLSGADILKMTVPAKNLLRNTNLPTVERIESLGRGVLHPRRKYAVLIAGGGSYANNHIRYWNDLLCMYNILTSNGYPSENIYVIYHDGLEPDDEVEGKVSGDMPVHYSARRANITKVFDDLSAKMTPNDTLFIMINDHGGGCLTVTSGDYEPGLYGGRWDTDNETTEDIISERDLNWDFDGDGRKAGLLRADESFVLGPGYGSMYDDDFLTEVNKIRNYDTMVIVMEQCFSGGFIDDLRAPNRVIISAASPNQISRARWPKSGVAAYNEFTYWFFTALMGRTPDGGAVKNPAGKTVTIEADLDENGRLSMQEVFNWARRMDAADEHPHYDDDGLVPSQTGYIPYQNTAGLEGYVGSRTFL